MTLKVKRRYLDYADKIPYSPDVNLFSTGGEIASAVIQAAALQHAANLNEFAARRHLDWMDEQQDLTNDLKRTVEGRQMVLQNDIALQLSKEDNIRSRALASLQLLAERILNLFPSAPSTLMIIPSASTIGNSPDANTFAGGGGLDASAIGGLVSAGLALDHSLGTAIAGDYRNGAGEVISSIPGLGMAGGVFSRAFGMKTNKAELQRVISDKTYLNNAALAAGTATSFDSSALNAPMAINTNVSAYKGGWFSGGKAKGKNAELQQQLIDVRNFANNAVENGIRNVADNQMSVALSNFFGTGGAIDYAFMNDYLTNGHIRALQSGNEPIVQNQLSGYPSGTVFAEGGRKPTPQYTEGGTYNISEEEYRRLLDEGYEIQVIK